MKALGDGVSILVLFPGAKNPLSLVQNVNYVYLIAKKRFA